ncbi:hypothetical protein GE061_000579 [Apolygus lucorum]|uniref:LSM domain-containing protein n=1 Tax=Apolygus lucorum TaxID=248454 RepID=A0A6A4K9N6_APOLU|nr:hypothetical protein GE061_000579 [Apolygus lucorum]
MSLAPHNIVLSNIIRSIGRQVIIYTSRGLVIEGILREVDSDHNLLIGTGLVYWCLGLGIERTYFLNLTVKGSDISCFNPGPFVSVFDPINEPQKSPVPTRRSSATNLPKDAPM